jgi:hypothetical protein
MRFTDRSVLAPPIFAALAFTVPESIQLMHRPDSIYIPVIFEIPIFAISYIAFAIISIFCVAPLSKLALSRGSSRAIAIIYAIVIAVVGTYLIYLVEFFGHKSTIFHRAYVFGSFIPFFVLAAASFHYAKAHEIAVKKN